MLHFQWSNDDFLSTFYPGTYRDVAKNASWTVLASIGNLSIVRRLLSTSTQLLSCQFCLILLSLHILERFFFKWKKTNCVHIYKTEDHNYEENIGPTRDTSAWRRVPMLYMYTIIWLHCHRVGKFYLNWMKYFCSSNDYQVIRTVSSEKSSFFLLLKKSNASIDKEL